MKISLPENYSYKDIADVYNGVLYIHRLASFRSLMFDLTYSIIGTTYYCRYCGQEVTRTDATLDHIFPVHLGGPYVPENLDIACADCNVLKKDMLEEDFLYFLSLNELDRLKYQQNYKEHRIYKLQKLAPVIPKSWYKYISLDEIDLLKDSRKGKKDLEKERNFFDQFKRISTPLIVDSNFLLLDGYYTAMVAKENNINMVPVIILENVILEY